MPDLSYRTDMLEIMDDFDLPSAEITPVLEGLGKMNALFGGHKSIINALKKFAVSNNYAVSDWGCGGGDALIAIAKWAEEKKIHLKLNGIDAAPTAVNYARQQASGYKNISFTRADVIDEVYLIKPADIIICSLFTHHFDDERWITLIQNMHTSAQKGIIITDLHRHWLLYHAIVFITRVFTRNAMARNDGPLSVKRGFKRHELLALLKKAQIDNFKLTWRWPFRWELIIYKS
ncbi:2-polyprenyl-3-methyl-5-hydroxy-6-metoxy-1,4-benzoquinol methylase [Mucilaginibacter sp. SG538B]|uniref:methyltransferase domain-containing protein n=1 Tax=unclassified Mucilaginibacter TaxID=2617802 RepID=UPI00159EAB32|nr:methyltransferase domain-containing protein [Mucilaginibacter sp. SG538B]NVM64549.1 2-polyprenyl-3-methyl-5-hydroxy-6-metoxy-1,4-benzoquinol methylase [Mucilaginibacter sp. SG538B]